MKSITLLFAPPRFPVKLIQCIALGLASSVCCLLKSMAKQPIN